MKIRTSLLAGLLMVGGLGATGTRAGAEDMLSFADAKGALSEVRVSSFCYMRFPAIREETLYSDRPVLKDASSGDIIDFFGSCDHDPLGKDEIWSQRLQSQREREGD